MAPMLQVGGQTGLAMPECPLQHRAASPSWLVPSHILSSGDPQQGLQQEQGTKKGAAGPSLKRNKLPRIWVRIAAITSGTVARRGHPCADSVSWAGTLPRVAGNMDSSTQNKERIPDGPGE